MIRTLSRCITFLAVLSPGFANITFNTFVTQSSLDAAEGQNSTISFAYAGNKFVGGLYYGVNNTQLYQTDLTGGNVQKFGAPMPTGSGEVVVAASYNNGGFTAGDIYAASSDASIIYHYSNSGGAPTPFLNLTGEGGIKYIFFDPGSSFGGDMLVATSNGNIYKVTSAGVASLLVSTGQTVEGMDIATSNWGVDAGNLVIASESAYELFMYNPSGGLVSSVGGIPLAETASFVPLNLGASGNPVEGLYVANYPVDIQKADVSQFAGLQGDLIATSEENSNAQVWDVKYSGNALAPFGTPTLIGNLPGQSEDATFVTAQRIQLATTPEPGSIILFGTFLAGVVYSVRRKFAKR